MPTPTKAILRIEVPVIVQLGERRMKLSAVRGLVPGAIIELNKDADEDLELLVHNRLIGSGTAVKVGENFGIRVRTVGDPASRLAAAARAPAPLPAETDQDELDAEALAEQMLKGQL